MSKCPFYQVLVRNYKSREILPCHQVQNHRTVNIPWCSHKHSPASQKVAFVAGGANLLTCKGDTEKCPLSEAERFDI